MLEAILEETKEYKGVSVSRPLPQTRYFIELHVSPDADGGRMVMDEMRRHKAYEFISIVSEWLDDVGAKNEVSSLTVTALGQVMLVCTHRVIDLIRSQDIWGIAHIRSADQMGDLRRIAGRV